jgi:hypothetical protein
MDLYFKRRDTFLIDSKPTSKKQARGRKEMHRK